MEQSSDERIIAHLAFARSVASRSLDPRCRGADREDLVAWGVLGLVQAARRYRDDTGAPFGAYAARRVRGQVLDALRQRDPLTRAARRAYRAAREQDANLPQPVVVISLDRWTETDHDPSGQVAPVCRSERDRRWATVARELQRMAPIERKVLVLSFGRGLTLKEIGVLVGLSESGVCRLRARVLRRVRSRCA
ncbi:MAG TPA: sigma-70 family RNA polymerase sigma factor [Candidatus Limnocylindria bacterium]|nr:sigma-70 family RNA polymerase sigma factor [Candidatus Limnocylindria bacterium]